MMWRYLLEFDGSFHVDGRGSGSYGEPDPFLRSDSLSAALLSVWTQIDPAGADQRFREPPFLLSSAFPFWKEVYFLPRPIASRHVILSDDRFDQAKPLKAVQWLSEWVWGQVAAGRTLNDLDQKGEVKIQGKFALRKQEYQESEFPNPLYAEDRRERLAMDRSTNAHVEGQLFTFTGIRYHQGGGLHLLVAFEDETVRPAFEAALELLGENGVGADRNVGHGRFRVSAKAAERWKRASKDHTAVALSLVNPAPEELHDRWWENEKSAYDLILRGGWIAGTPWRRRPVRMLTEGSVLPKPLQGRMVEVTPDDVPLLHPVFRDGRGLFVEANA